MFQKILVAIDRSQVGEHVFDEALSLARANHAHLMLLHVLSPYEEGYPGLINYYPEVDEQAIQLYLEQLEEFKQQGLNLLRSHTHEAIAIGVSAEFKQIPGTPGYVICDLALTWGADLIIVGRRGLGDLKELVLGSVSNYVTHHTPCSVLVIHQQDT